MQEITIPLLGPEAGPTYGWSALIACLLMIGMRIILAIDRGTQREYYDRIRERAVEAKETGIRDEWNGQIAKWEKALEKERKEVERHLNYSRDAGYESGLRAGIYKGRDELATEIVADLLKRGDLIYYLDGVTGEIKLKTATTPYTAISPLELDKIINLCDQLKQKRSSHAGTNPQGN